MPLPTPANRPSSLSPTSSSCAGRGSCSGLSSPRGDMPVEIWDKVKDHPCYSEEAHHYFARMHVAVAPSCNIQCNYCNRKYDCSNESRPGVVSEKLTPEQAMRKVVAVAAKLPQLSVLGIAGPGDALANPRRTFATFSLVREALPHLKLCLSTNGLALPDHVETIKAFGIDHVTVTISMVDPAIGEKIYPWISYDGRRWTGREASQILHERQMQGLEMLVAAGILVKVNSVLIPGINDAHIDEINRVVKAKGAFLHNVMPLISDPAHGTHFGLTGQRGPTPVELHAVQERLEGGARLMRHCRQCRADAVGLLSQDLSGDFSLDKLPEAPRFEPAAREMYLRFVEQERDDRARAVAEIQEEAVLSPQREAVLVAVATKGGGRINQHFGHAREFQIYRVEDAKVAFQGIRRVDNYCQGGFGEDDILPATIEALKDVSAVFVARVGRGPRAALEKAGLEVVENPVHDYIERALLSWWSAADTAIQAAAG
ncbi:MAG: nitrogenase cofactor biosynthesis protein NifB [Rhodospirillaceae bacterium]|nr:nitrogenase cofactor biosynthesis protein NifB [Rhodospirillaceae bacterium]